MHIFYSKVFFERDVSAFSYLRARAPSDCWKNQLDLVLKIGQTCFSALFWVPKVGCFGFQPWQPKDVQELIGSSSSLHSTPLVPVLFSIIWSLESGLRINELKRNHELLTPHLLVSWRTSLVSWRTSSIGIMKSPSMKRHFLSMNIMKRHSSLVSWRTSSIESIGCTALCGLSVELHIPESAMPSPNLTIRVGRWHPTLNFPTSLSLYDALTSIYIWNYLDMSTNIQTNDTWRTVWLEQHIVFGFLLPSGILILNDYATRCKTTNRTHTQKKVKRNGGWDLDTVQKTTRWVKFRTTYSSEFCAYFGRSPFFWRGFVGCSSSVWRVDFWR